MLPNRAGAIHEWNKLMQTMRPKLGDNKIKEQYYDCYYHMAYCLYKNALKMPVAKTRTHNIRVAANWIFKLEAKQDAAADICKKRFQELLEQETALKEQYNDLKKNAP